MLHSHTLIEYSFELYPQSNGIRKLLINCIDIMYPEGLLNGIRQTRKHNSFGQDLTVKVANQL